MPDWRDEVRRAIAELNLDLPREQAIVDELAEHLSARFDELARAGIAGEQAYRAVMEELSEARLRTELRPMFKEADGTFAPGMENFGGYWDGLGNDIRLAARQLRLNPGFALVALLSLALGVGANTAIFELIDAVVLRTLPVPDPQQLAEVHLIHGGRIGSTVARQKDVSSAIWDQFRPQQRAFSDVAAWSTERFDLGHGGEARYADGMWVSGSFFHVLEVQPTLGRLIAPSDDVKGCGVQAAVISYAFWQSQFGGRANAVGSTISLDRMPFQIVGITPPTFSGLEVGRKFDVALPLCSEPAVHGADGWTKSQTTWWLAIIGRLKPGWSFERGSAQFRSIARGIFAATLPAEYDAIERKSYLSFSFRADPAATGDSPLRKEFEQPLYLLLAISGLVLFIACANIANLMLARASARLHEMALRLALGASRARIARQLLVESMLLALLGAAAGAALAHLLGRILIAEVGSSQDQVYLSLAPDWRMLAFTAGLALLTCVVFGVAPAIQSAKTDPGAIARTSGRGLTAAREGLWLRRGFIVSQIALSLLLVAGSLLFVRTFRNLMEMNAGFDQDGVLVADFDFSALNLPQAQRIEYERNLLAQVRATPGVGAAAGASIVPLSGNGWNEFLDFPGTSMQRVTSMFNRVSEDYFRTLRTPMIAGRGFDANDTVDAPLVAIVNCKFAQNFFAGANPVGATFGIRQDAGKPDKLYRIVGLVEDTKYATLREDDRPIAYLPVSQDPAPDLDLTMVVRSSQNPGLVTAALKNVAARNSREIVLSFSVLRTSIREGLGRERLMAALSGFYGALAALLAMVGLYGIMTYSVARRKTEIGIRMALGATRRRILAMILRDALTLLGIGLAAGTVLVIASGRAVKSMLFGLQPTDPLTLGLAMAGLALVALMASFIPARRAAALQPMQTLRDE
ncbi:MAG: ABC transporter permease [Terracidiphilus sp.]